MKIFFLYFFLNVLPIDFREREKRNIHPLSQPFMHLLVDSSACLDQRLNPQPQCIGTTLQPIN